MRRSPAPRGRAARVRGVDFDQLFVDLAREPLARRELARLGAGREADGERDDPDNALGPYPTPQQARDWRTLRDARDEAWQEADDAWSDDPEGPCE